ncbi:TATA element modulatory factor-like isoform X2 [Ambystoma mexicanum]|uniref:TATA element modulatory factor-like isoform X2 n=1 Tax=Ambystoma mexicanum TaxID=8296 RepID=UPI0037E8B4B5
MPQPAKAEGTGTGPETLSWRTGTHTTTPRFRNQPLRFKMESRTEAMNDVCRVCANRLQGNQRRWIFGHGGRASLQVVLSHVLGQTVMRDGRGEFLCSKCVHVLERLYRFDTVISRVEALSLEKLQRLLTEKDKLGQSVRHSYARHHKLSGRPAYQGQDITVDIVGLPHVQYNMLLNEDMALSEYESWSERSGNCCPEGGCRSRTCYSCSAFRVPDSEYESVCHMPRQLRRLRPDVLYQLSRDKSRSMPMDLQRPSRSSSLGGGGSSYGGSVRSLRIGSLGAAMSASNMSLDTALDSEGDPFEDPRSPRSLLEVAETIRGIEYHPVTSPPHCKIPVRVSRGSVGSTPPSPILKLEYDGVGVQGNGTGLESPRHVDFCPDLLQELSDEYLNLTPQVPSVIVSNHDGTAPTHSGPPPKAQENGGDPVEHQHHILDKAGSCSIPQHESLIRRLTESLHSKEGLLQDCVGLLKTLRFGNEPLTDVKGALIEKLQQRLKERDQALQRAADDKFSALELKEEEAERLRQALREKDRDVARLTDVLRKNEEMIRALRDVLQLNEVATPKLEAMYKSLQQASQERDELRIYALQEKDSMIASLQEALVSSNKDVEALADSLIGQGLDSSQAPPSSSSKLLVSQLQEKERLLLRAQEEKSQQSSVHQQEAQKLLAKVASQEAVLKEQLQDFNQALASQSQEAKDLRQRLVAKEQELSKRKSQDSAASQERTSELSRLYCLLDEKDHTIMKFLQDSLEKERIICKLQERFRDSLKMETLMKPAA